MAMIQFEDDLMVVRDPEGNITYKGIVDEYVNNDWSGFERYWRYDEKQGVYIHRTADGIETLEVIDI